jgi:hypothetical protein
MSERDAIDFLNTLSTHRPEEERLILCGPPGDPEFATPTDWKPRPWRQGNDIPFGLKYNAYVTVASFNRAGDGSYRRRSDCFGSGLAFMIDDVGDSPSSKINRSLVDILPPNAIVETSEGNEQWWYIFTKPINAPTLKFLIDGFIHLRLLGLDPGMSGITRVGRLPGFINGKAKHKGWICKLKHLDQRFTSPERLREAFQIDTLPIKPEYDAPTYPQVQNRIAAWKPIYAFLSARGMFKRDDFDPSGWREMTCPWVDDHGNGADSGAAMRRPHADNGYYGAFRCHHGHCIDKGWRELTDWVNEIVDEETADFDAQVASVMYHKMLCDKDPASSKSMKRYWNEKLTELIGEWA